MRRENVGEGKGAQRKSHRLPNRGTRSVRANAGSEGSWSQNRHLSASEPLTGGHGEARCRRSPKPDILIVTRGRIEGRWAAIEGATLPSEGPLASGRCNCDTLSPKRRSNAVVMKRGPAEEAVVIVKPGADDPAVTLVRVKHQVSDRRLEVKGRTRKRSWVLMRDQGSEISEWRAEDYPRRRRRANRPCRIDDRPLQKRE